MKSSLSFTILVVIVVDIILVVIGGMNVSFPFSEPRTILDLLPLLLEGLSLLLQVPSSFDLSPGLPGLEGVLLEAWG